MANNDDNDNPFDNYHYLSPMNPFKLSAQLIDWMVVSWDINGYIYIYTMIANQTSNIMAYNKPMNPFPLMLTYMKHPKKFMDQNWSYT